MIKSFRQWYDRYERWLIPAVLLLGVTIDFITFKTISLKSAFILLGIHAVVAGLAILWVNGRSAHRFVMLVLQFTFGALLSASLVFYWFSGVLSVSWPLLGILALLIASNELFRERYLQPPVQIGVYYFALFSVATLIFPYVFNSISPWVFLFGALVSVLVIWVYLWMATKLVLRLYEFRYRLRGVVIVVFVVMNALYWLNIIPPIPLSLREADVYLDVYREGGEYVLVEPERSLIERLMPGTVMRIDSVESLAIFASVFAPAELETQIVHRWERFDEDLRAWVVESELTYTIAGGREDGYRGYSIKSAPKEGKWRVDIMTPRGQTLGRVRFTVEHN